LCRIIQIIKIKNIPKTAFKAINETDKINLEQMQGFIGVAMASVINQQFSTSGP